MKPAPRASVVIPYYRRQDQLDIVLAALDVQTLAPRDFEVVVADDGSPEPPQLGSRSYAVRSVSQPDEGFRAAAARNLGAQASTGDAIVFLDQDCLPAADYLASVLRAVQDPWSLALGHRRHVDVGGWSPDSIRAWLAADGPAPTELDEPQWLLDGYARTADLVEPDDRSYQLVISAVLSMHRSLFDRLGGFDASFRGYGGEDWELGHRALVAGADLCYLPDAVVWHDGPDLAGRSEDLTRAKNAETLSLAPLIPDPDVRGGGLVWARPDIVIRLAAGEASLARLVASVESLLDGSDAHVWVADPVAAGRLLTVLQDPRVHGGEPGPDVLTSARFHVECDAVVVSGATLRVLSAAAPLEGPGFRVRRARDVHRTARGCGPALAGDWPEGAAVEVLEAEPVLERVWQGRVRTR